MRNRLLRKSWPATFVISMFAVAGIALSVSADDSASTKASKSSSNDDANVSTSDRIAKLIAQLGDPQYLVRQAAQEQLLRLGPEAFDALTAAENSDDVEITARAKYLLQQIPLDRDFDSPLVKRILQGYSIADESGRLARIRQLALLPQGAGTPALCRLLRYEKSQVLSKQAALQLLLHLKASPEERSAQAKIISAALTGSPRAAARWLQTETDSGSAGAKFDNWSKFIDDEISTLRNSPSDTSSEIIMALARRQADALMKANDRDHAVQMMRKMIAIAKPEIQPLAQMTDWFIKQQAPELVTEAAKRFETAFHGSPVLMYFVAQASAMQGNKLEAEQFAKEASQLMPQGDRAARRRIATVLRERGLFDWSEREYRHVIDSAPNEPESIIARYFCAEMLHDLDRDGDAAEILQKAVEAFGRNRQLEQQVRELGVTEGSALRWIKSWMHYFAACDAFKKGDRDKEWENLDKSIQLDPKNEDVLIAMYKASSENPTRRKVALDLIRKVSAQLLNEVTTAAGQPIEATACNQYAWLVGNTEGDIDQAIQLSQKSVDLVLQRSGLDDDSDLDDSGGTADRDLAGHLDTLAHCYAGKRDYASAVKYQSRAMELEPHSMAIVRALEEFKTKLADNTKSESP